MDRVTSTDVLVPPPAVRLVRPGWRDPRLLVGLVLVCASVLLGARLLSSGDETTPVWATRSAVAAGARLGPDDLQVVRVRFASEQDAQRYLSAASPLEGAVVATRDLGEGELVPAAAVDAGGEALRELPLTVPAGSVPPGVGAGDRVDVYVVPRQGGGSSASSPGSRLVLEDVPVLSAGRGGVGGPEALRQVVVGVEGSTDVGGLVEQLGTGTALLVGRP
jgi:Flp pilus assembly protein CpaB